MHAPRIPLKRPWLAGILALLLPGLGHAYQGRWFKAALYFVCIIGLFVIGLVLSGGQAVQPPPKGAFKSGNMLAILKYSAQAAAGAPALVGLVQRERYYSPNNVAVDSIPRPFSTPFRGIASYQDETGHHTGNIEGIIFLEPAEERFGRGAITGRFEGKFEGKPVKLQLSNHVQLSRPIEANPERGVTSGILVNLNGNQTDLGHLSGAIPRAFSNWYAVPADELDDQNLHDRLGKFYELAMVFTWVAGLLNILAIWDAVEGPAYGIGRSEPEGEPKPGPA